MHLSSLYNKRYTIFNASYFLGAFDAPTPHTFLLKTAVEDFIRKEQKDRKVKRKRGND